MTVLNENDVEHATLDWLAQSGGVSTQISVTPVLSISRSTANSCCAAAAADAGIWRHGSAGWGATVRA